MQNFDKKRKCVKCGDIESTHNIFRLSWANGSYPNNRKLPNLNKFVLCFQCSDNMALWLTKNGDGE